MKDVRSQWMVSMANSLRTKAGEVSSNADAQPFSTYDFFENCGAFVRTMGEEQGVRQFRHFVDKGVNFYNFMQTSFMNSP